MMPIPMINKKDLKLIEIFLIRKKKLIISKHAQAPFEKSKS